MNERDNPIDLNKFLDEHNIIRDVLLDYLYKHKTDEKKVRNILEIDTKDKYTTLLLEEGKIKPSDLEIPKRLKLIERGLILKEEISNIDELLYKDGSVYIVYKDYSDLDFMELFDEDKRKYVSSILSGENITYSTSDSFDYDDAIYNMDSDNESLIKKIIAARKEKVEIEGEEITITPDNIDEYEVSDLLDVSEFSDIRDILENSYLSARDSADESEVYLSVMKEIESRFQGIEWLTGDDRKIKWRYDGEYKKDPETGKYYRDKVEISENLGLKLTNIKQLIHAYDVSMNIDTENYKLRPAVALRIQLYEESEQLNPNTDVYGRVKDVKEFFNENLRDNLPDVTE